MDGLVLSRVTAGGSFIANTPGAKTTEAFIAFGRVDALTDAGVWRDVRRLSSSWETSGVTVVLAMSASCIRVATKFAIAGQTACCDRRVTR